MSDHSAIEWTDATWNPTTGCTKVSPGCDNCYAEKIVERFKGKGAFAQVTLNEGRLTAPLRWRKPRRIFVNSMSDLFHDDVPDEYIARVFAVMAATPQHTYQLLTKRHGRMRSLLSSINFDIAVADEWSKLGTTAGSVIPDHTPPYPLPNVWLGVSVEDQKRADLRIPVLLDTPAAVRFLSCEPLLGPLDLHWCDGVDAVERDWTAQMGAPHPLVDWVIVGGESGPGARPMHPDWARSLRDQCTDAGVPFFFKQWGAWAPLVAGTAPGREIRAYPGAILQRVGKHAAGRELDGRTWDQYPRVAEAVTT